MYRKNFIKTIPNKIIIYTRKYNKLQQKVNKETYWRQN